jgi:phosphoenolpyruvate carboxylase
VKPGGYIVATVIREIWQTGGYEAHVKSLAEQNKIKVLSAELQDYRRGAGAKAYYLVLQVSA